MTNEKNSSGSSGQKPKPPPVPVRPPVKYVKDEKLIPRPIR